MGIKKFKLSTDDKERESQLLEILLRYDNEPFERDRYQKANKHLTKPLSERTWKRYKKRYGWSFEKDKTNRPKKVRKRTKRDGLTIQTPMTPDEAVQVKHQSNYLKIKTDNEIAQILSRNTVELPEPIVEPKEAAKYSQAEKNKLVEFICNLYSTGIYYIHQLCNSQGIHYSTFLSWVTSDQIYMNKYESAKERGFDVFNDLFLDAFKQMSLRKMFAEYEVTETLVHEFVPKLDRETGKMIFDRKPVKSVITKRPTKPDAEMVRMFITTLHELRTRKSESDQIRRPEFEGIEDPVELLMLSAKLLNESGDLDEDKQKELDELIGSGDLVDPDEE